MVMKMWLMIMISFVIGLQVGMLVERKWEDGKNR